MEIKKIVYIGEFTRAWNEEGNAQGFEKCGIKVIRVPENEFDFEKFIEILDREVPDLVLMAKLRIPIDRFRVLEVLKQRNIKTASWTFDLYYGLTRENLIGIDPIFKCDYVFGPDGGNVQRFRDNGVNYHLLRQGIHDEYCFRGKSEEKYSYDVIFVGHWDYDYSPRGKLCKFLGQNYKFRWFGRYNTLERRGGRLNDLYASAKIIVGDSYYSQYYWSNRLYETLGRGGFLMFNKIPGLDKEYGPYKHYIPYNMGDFETLKEKIDYFLARPEDMEKISSAALEYTKNNHTLAHRAKQFLEICGSST